MVAAIVEPWSCIAPPGYRQRPGCKNCAFVGFDPTNTSQQPGPSRTFEHTSRLAVCILVSMHGSMGLKRVHVVASRANLFGLPHKRSSFCV